MKKLVTLMDLSRMDEVLLRYAAALQQKFDGGQIHLLHYVELQDMLDDVAGHFTQLNRPIREVIEEELRDKALAAGLNETDFTLEVHEEGGQEDFLQTINEGGFALCLIGKKVIHQGTGVLAGKMARLLEIPTMFITETARTRWDRILVPVDFSPHAARSLHQAAIWAKSLQSFISVLHVQHLPPVYFPFLALRSEKGIRELQEKTQRQLDQFCRKHLPDTARWENHLIQAGEDNVARSIYNFARQAQIDLLIMGLKGRTDDDGLLIGTVAERMIQSDRDIPVLITR